MFEAAELGHKLSKGEYKRIEPTLRADLLDAQYELYKNGTPINPASVKFTMRAQLSKGELAAFKSKLRRLLAVPAGAPSAPEVTRAFEAILAGAWTPVQIGAFAAALRLRGETAEGEIMGLSHRERRVQGVQFHPESILTAHGKSLLANWLKGLAS